MNNTIPKISVMVITYNQEDVINRTLDAIVAQKDYLFEVCISDDCSSDTTWVILQDYQSRYPDFIKLHRNDPNRGIFENIEQVRSMPIGDIVTTVAGDDLPGDGWYKKVVEFIAENGIDYKNELFCIYGDYKCIYPNGDSIIHKHSAIVKVDDVFRLALRGAINGRGCCYSRKILSKFKKLSLGRSHIAENAQDRQLQIFSEKNYYIPMVGNVYYTKRGISVHLTEELKQERMQIWPYSIKCFKDLGIELNKKDQTFVKHRMAYQEYVYWGTKRKALLSFWYYLMSFDLKLFLASDTLRGLFFAIRRRLPHKYIINMN